MRAWCGAPTRPSSRTSATVEDDLADGASVSLMSDAQCGCGVDRRSDDGWGWCLQVDGRAGGAAQPGEGSSCRLVRHGRLRRTQDGHCGHQDRDARHIDAHPRRQESRHQGLYDVDDDQDRSDDDTPPGHPGTRDRTAPPAIHGPPVTTSRNRSRSAASSSGDLNSTCSKTEAANEPWLNSASPDSQTTSSASASSDSATNRRAEALWFQRDHARTRPDRSAPGHRGSLQPRPRVGRHESSSAHRHDACGRRHLHGGR